MRPTNASERTAVEANLPYSVEPGRQRAFCSLKRCRCVPWSLLGFGLRLCWRFSPASAIGHLGGRAAVLWVVWPTTQTGVAALADDGNWLQP